MRALRFIRIAGLSVALAAAAAGASAGEVSAAAAALELCALPGSTAPSPTSAPSVTVPIWGFGVPTTPGDCNTASPTLPGPVLVAQEGDVVTFTVHNALPAGHQLSFEAPGVPFTAGPIDAPVGGTVTRTFTAVAGTYLYSSTGDAGRQRAMGLYGMLIVRPGTANRAYAPATSTYDVEAPVLMSVLDPAFNVAPDTFDLLTYRATWWLINGRAYPDTARIHAVPGQRVLLRYANAGYDNTTMTMLGGHQRVLARDAHLLPTVTDAAAETIPSGATEDTIVTVPAGIAPGPNGYALYNRQLHVTNGSQSGVNPFPVTGGGMMTFIGP